MLHGGASLQRAALQRGALLCAALQLRQCTACLPREAEPRAAAAAISSRAASAYRPSALPSAASCRPWPLIVHVLPDPVCPKAKTVEVPPRASNIIPSSKAAIVLNLKLGSRLSTPASLIDGRLITPTFPY